MVSIIAAVAGALISGFAAIVVCLLTNRAQNSKTIAILETRLDNLVHMIDRLEEAQNKHNSVVERMYHLEERTSVQDEQIASISRRVDDLERAG